MSSMYLNSDYTYTDPTSGVISTLQFTSPSGFMMMNGSALVNDVIYGYTLVSGNSLAAAIAIFGPDTNNWNLVPPPLGGTVNGNTINYPITTEPGSGLDDFQATTLAGWSGAAGQVNYVEFSVAGPNPAPQTVTIHLLGSGAIPH